MEAKLRRESSAYEQLIAAAKVAGLPDGAFLPVMTPRRRREIVYTVESKIDDPEMVIELEVHGSGAMKVQMCVAACHFEGGDVVTGHTKQEVLWGEDGTPAIITTSLNHRHLTSLPSAADVMRAFISTFGFRSEASCAGGYDAWRAMMQLTTTRIARERHCPVEIVAHLPLPLRHLVDDNHSREATTFEVNDIADTDHPVAIHGYEDELGELDAHMAPSASCQLLVPPGLIIRQRHKEIFQAE